MHGNKLGPLMPGKEPFYSRTTFGYVVVGLGITLAGAVLFTPLANLIGKRLMDRFTPEQRPASVHVPSTTPSTSDPVPSASRATQPATKSPGSPGTGLRSAIKTSAADG